MADSIPTFLITRLLGISGSLFLSGFAFSASYYSMPALALAPIPLQLKQWQVVYDLGKLVSPPVSAASAVLWGIAAWESYSGKNGGSEWMFYSAAGLFTFAVPLWTVIFMMGTNKDLMQRTKIAAEVESTDSSFGAQSEQSLKTWDNMNMVRAVLPLVGAWIGLYAALK